MKTNKEMLEYLISIGVLRSKHIADAFYSIDRKDFVPDLYQADAYVDRPLAIGLGQTISQPKTIAMMLAWLEPIPTNKILDVGSGSGYTTSLLAKIVTNQGLVYGLEIVPELVIMGQTNLAKYKFKNATIRLASKELGLAAEAPFDKILVSAAAEQLPDKLVEQLANGGTLVVPVKNSVFVLQKDANGRISSKEHLGFSFVPLLDN